MLTPLYTSRLRAVRPLRVRTAQHGAALLEALVAILLLMLGILALIGLQGRMVSASTETQMRGEATYLADQLIGQMSVDEGNLTNYVTASNTCASTFCQAWLQNVANTLPSGTATITVNNTLVNVQINWTPANSTTRNVQVSTVINF